MLVDGYLPGSLRSADPDKSLKDDPYAAADAELAQKIYSVVNRYYPNHPWKIISNIEQGIVQINLPLFMGINYYVIKVSHLKNDPSLKLVKNACGEILERYQIPRQGFDRDHFQTAVAAMPYGTRGSIHGFVPK